MKKYPPDAFLGKQIVFVATTTCKDGLESFSVIEVEKQKVGDALVREKTAFIKFRNIEGFNYEIRFFSDLVVESLINFQCKVPWIMEPISFTFYDFNFVIHPFEFASMNGVLAVI